MARTASLEKPKKATINIETELHGKAVQRAKTIGITGGFSEYVARLIASDMRRRGSVAIGASRHLNKA